MEWDKLLDMAIKVATLITTIGVARMVAYFNKRNMRFETYEKLNRFKIDKQVEAGMAFWSLLAYATETENPSSILIWEKDRGSNEIKWYYRKTQAVEFMNRLSEINYEKGHGFFLSRDTREHFYKYRNHLYSLNLSEKNNDNKEIQITEEMATELKRLYSTMNEALRAELQPEKRTL